MAGGKRKDGKGRWRVGGVGGGGGGGKTCGRGEEEKIDRKVKEKVLGEVVPGGDL